MVAALLEMRRNGMSDRSGVRAVRRLLGNGWWLGIYALLVEASLTLAMIAGLMVGISRYLLLGLLFLSFLIVNLAAILWATIRTASTDDVLSPRVSRGKWRASTRAIE